MAGVGLGQLLLALDATLVRLVEAPRGLDLPVGSAALIDSDDVRLGLAAAASSADVFFLLGVADDEALRWMDKQARERVPVAIFAKEPSAALVSAAVGRGSAVVAVEPRARWERLYQLINHVLEHHGDRADATEDSGTDLFGLAQSLADRIHGMVSIENAQSHVLAYSASNDEADELRRLSILGRAGPPEHLEWIGQWGIFDALRASDAVVRVAERPELGLRPRLAVGIYQEVDARRPPAFAGTIWVQQGARPLAADAEEILRGAAVLAGRIMARLAARPSTHARRVQQLLGLIDGEPDVAAVARELGLAADGHAALIGWDASDTAGAARPARLADVMALSASAFRRDAQLAARGSRIYVLLPQTQTRSVTSWVRGTIAAMRNELGVQLRAAIAAPVAGLAGIAAARAEVDRVLDSAARHPISIPQVTSLAEARTTVLLDEILALVGREQRSVDPRIVDLRSREPVLAETLRVYLDSFGDVADAARSLHVHPNTVRYRIRRIEKLMSTSLADPEVRLLFSLSLRVLDSR
ncbi:PucR family transcriptional regulator [Mycobacterium paraffinicum]|uniref:PucR family transcriptional regulator n=1 Tax=Mycobacterium paraffinicum TaxID=53378 RepID=A0ABP8RJQ0_9MYCO|nr:helix-turn-helix domain-containing protein [Mycobacterium paraffinicum]MCV7312694.1 PucR family transcriptional regulator [Mycobacterium paraffinicum]